MWYEYVILENYIALVKRCLFVCVSAAVNQLVQTEPPSVAVIDLFPDGGPEGEIQEYAPLPDR